MKHFRQRVVCLPILFIAIDTTCCFRSSYHNANHSQTDRLTKGEKKKGKDTLGGTASPHGSGSATSPTNSAQGTPTSSQTHLVESRNKPLPPENGMGSETRTQSGGALSRDQFGQGAQSGASPSHNSMYGPVPDSGSNGPSTPSRGGQPLAPQVVISPSVPVRLVRGHTNFLY